MPLSCSTGMAIWPGSPPTMTSTPIHGLCQPSCLLPPLLVFTEAQGASGSWTCNVPAVEIQGAAPNSASPRAHPTSTPPTPAVAPAPGWKWQAALEAPRVCRSARCFWTPHTSPDACEVPLPLRAVGLRGFGNYSF